MPRQDTPAMLAGAPQSQLEADYAKSNSTFNSKAEIPALFSVEENALHRLYHWERTLQWELLILSTTLRSIEMHQLLMKMRMEILLRR